VTFRSIPDVPIRRLDLVLPEGKASIFAASSGLCTKRPLRMTTAITGQNGAEPGLSNRDVGRRVGVKTEVHASNVLARLGGRGLIENRRNGGRTNAWWLTAAGQRLERAIRVETLAAGGQGARERARVRVS
jgi:hypothetical protein